MANNTRQAGGAVEIVLLVLLASLWSSSFTFIKVAVETVPPLSVATGRLLIAAAIFLAVLRLRGLSLPVDPWVWARFLLIGLFANALPFSLIGWGEQTIDCGLAAILMAVMPLTTLLLAHYFTSDERLNPPRIAGMLLGFAGVA
ncbi:MAG: DMT family transporter, partial [Alphaproteobacteria bacterium]